MEIANKSLKYKFIFFDLDRTLWDFETNSIITFKDIFNKHNLHNVFPDFDAFINAYKAHNEILWAKYRLGEIKKNELRSKRFLLTLQDFGVNNQILAENIGTDYIEISPTKKELFPHSIEVLEYLHKKYTLGIITNGFKEVQHKKLKNCKLDKYFKSVFCSEDVGHQKPRPEIFQFALSSLNAKKTESLMIGDDFNVDIIGAKNYGIDSVFFNPNKMLIDLNKERITEISSLKELINIL
jgi:putative hydrolase of the HAD superfamily